MSAGPHSRGDSSSQSGLTLQDISLGSLPSFSTPGKYRIPSTSSATSAPSSNPVSTPSPGTSLARRRPEDVSISTGKRLTFSKQSNNEDEDDADADIFDKGEIMATPMPNRLSSAKRKSGVGSKGTSNLTLRDQEKHIDALKKENFNIKLKVHFLEERLAQLAPDQIDAALKQNINLKIEVQQRGLEMKRYKKLVLQLERELERMQRGQGRDRELEDKAESLERELREVRRRKGGVGPMDEELRERNEDLENHAVMLQHQLEEMQKLFEENALVVQDLQDQLERKDGAAGNESVNHRRSRLEGRIAELVEENEQLRDKLDECHELLTQKEDEREELEDKLENLSLQMEDMARRREAEMLDRSASRTQMIEEHEEREALEADLNALRDKVAAKDIELSQKEDEVELKEREIRELEAELDQMREQVESEWRGELEEARNQVEELRDVLVERDAESKELRMHISELEANTTDLHDKFETALAHLEREAEEKDVEIESANREIQKLGQRVFELEDELDNIKAESDKLRDDEAVERERLETLVAALKDKAVQYKSEMQEITDLYEQARDDARAHRARQEELAQHIEDLVEEMRHERDARQRVELEIESQANAHDVVLRVERRALESKESALQSGLADLARTQALLTQREADISDLQAALRDAEAEVRERGESATTDRFSLQLEVDRLRRDGDRLEEELKRARMELEARDTKIHERDDSVDRLHAENRDLTTQLAAQTQARLNMIDKLDASQNSLRATEAELAACKQRLNDLEQRLTKDQRSLLSSGKYYNDQVNERNQLLLTIYNYMEKILGVEKSAKKPETKPFTNFTVFHELIMTRLKALVQIANDFERRSKESETRYSEKLNEIRKQLDQKWKVVDKFEIQVKNLMDIKQSWRRKFALKEGELEALKSTNSELAFQISSIRRPGQSESLEIKSLQARAANAERRLTNAQNQLLAAEEKMAAMNQKTTVADGKWEARVKEYESRLRQAEERVKRERQGAKERVAELQMIIESLRRQIDIATKRNQQLNEVVGHNKTPSPKS